MPASESMNTAMTNASAGRRRARPATRERSHASDGSSPGAVRRSTAPTTANAPITVAV
jgi:hypothetical protein